MKLPPFATRRAPGPVELRPSSAAIEDVVPVVQRKATPTEPVAGPAADGSMTPPPVAMVSVVGPAELNLQLPVTVAETERVWVVLAARAEVETRAPVAARARAMSLRFMVVPLDKGCCRVSWLSCRAFMTPNS